jgi:acyl carrier protein
MVRGVDDPRLGQVLTVWADVLELPDVGPDDDFFALGGDSLALVRSLRGLQDALGVTVSAQAFLETRTARAMTARLDA